MGKTPQTRTDKEKFPPFLYKYRPALNCDDEESNEKTERLKWIERIFTTMRYVSRLLPSSTIPLIVALGHLLMHLLLSAGII